MIVPKKSSAGAFDRQVSAGQNLVCWQNVTSH
jgi:hypothetical protein